MSDPPVDSLRCEISIETLIESICDTYRRQVKRSGITFSSNFAANLPEAIHSDRLALIQIVSGMICRALRHTEEGEINIICLSHENTLHINIADPGDGRLKDDVGAVCQLLPSQKNRLPGSCQVCCGNRPEAVKNRHEELGAILNIKSETGIGTVAVLKLKIDPKDGSQHRQAIGESMVENWLDAHGNIPALRNAMLKSIPVLKKEIGETLPLVFNLELEAAKEKIHPLKGFTGGFGLKEIYEKLKEVESVLKTSQIVGETLIAKTIELDYLVRLIPDKYLVKDLADPQEPFDDRNIRVYEGLRDKSVLVADDQPMNREMIAYVLKNLNLGYRMVGNGEEVLESLKSKMFNLLLLDMQMPVMDGAETIRRIRADLVFKDLPIIVITAYNLQENRETILCDDFIMKPYDLIDLSERIERALTPANSSNA